MRSGTRSDCTKGKNQVKRGTKEEQVKILEGKLESDGEMIPIKIEARILGRTRKAVKVELSDRYDLNLFSNLLGRPIRRQCCLSDLSWEALLAAI